MHLDSFDAGNSDSAKRSQLVIEPLDVTRTCGSEPGTSFEIRVLVQDPFAAGHSIRCHLVVPDASNVAVGTAECLTSAHIVAMLVQSNAGVDLGHYRKKSCEGDQEHLV